MRARRPLPVAEPLHADMHRARASTRPMGHLPYFMPASARPRRAQRDEPEPPPVLPVRRPAGAAEGRADADRGSSAGIDAADLVVVGDGTYGDELGARQPARALRFLGRCRSRSSPAYAGRGRVLASSIGYETFGMISIEAFARRTPRSCATLAACRKRARERRRHHVPDAGRVARGHGVAAVERELPRGSSAARLSAYRERWSPEPHLRAYFEVDRPGDRETCSSAPRALRAGNASNEIRRQRAPALGSAARDRPLTSITCKRTGRRCWNRATVGTKRPFGGGGGRGGGGGGGGGEGGASYVGGRSVRASRPRQRDSR